MAIVTRFAPSPTGYLHLGGARVTLFNYVFAKSQGGQYLLRIEDTDKARSTSDAIHAIHEGLSWLGLEGAPAVMQSEQEARHRDVAAALLENGHAYRCYLSDAQLDTLRQKAKKKVWHSAPLGAMQPIKTYLATKPAILWSACVCLMWVN